MVTTMRAWKTNAARQLIPVVMTPPINGPVAAPTPPMPLITPNAQARDFMSWKNMVVRMYTGGINNAVPSPSRIEFPTISTPIAGETALSTAPTP